MWMTSDEICRLVRDANGKYKQIEICAELNCCSENQIVKILEDRGFVWNEKTNRFLFPEAPKLLYNPIIKEERGLVGRHAADDSVLKSNIKVNIEKEVKKEVCVVMANKKIVLDPKVEKKVIAEFLENGMTQKAIATKYGLSVWTVGTTIRSYLKAQTDASDEDSSTKKGVVAIPVVEDRKKPIELGSVDSTKTEALYQSLCLLDYDSIKSLRGTVSLQIVEKEKELNSLRSVADALDDILSHKA